MPSAYGFTGARHRSPPESDASRSRWLWWGPGATPLALPARVIHLLIVDDSPLMRRLLGSAFAAAGGFEVAFARDGMEALDRFAAWHPDVVTLDLNMPGIGGLAVLDRLMLLRPCPVVLVSARATAGAAETARGLALGAVDFCPKPAGAVSLHMTDWAPVLVEKVRAAASLRLPATHRLTERLRAARATLPAAARPARRRRGAAERLVLIGTSTGGPPALDAVLAALPGDFPWPVLVAQHMPANFTSPLARRLDGICALAVHEVTAPMPLQPGHVYVAQGDADMLVSRRAGGAVALAAPADPDRRWHPSVDRLVESAARHLPADRLVGVLMTGMGNDGAAAMTALHAAGGTTIAEDESTAVVWGMPGALVRAGGATHVERLEAIAARLVALA